MEHIVSLRMCIRHANIIQAIQFSEWPRSESRHLHISCRKEQESFACHHIHIGSIDICNQLITTTIPSISQTQHTLLSVVVIVEAIRAILQHFVLPFFVIICQMRSIMTYPFLATHMPNIQCIILLKIKVVYHTHLHACHQPLLAIGAFLYGCGCGTYHFVHYPTL